MKQRASTAECKEHCFACCDPLWGVILVDGCSAFSAIPGGHLIWNARRSVPSWCMKITVRSSPGHSCFTACVSTAAWGTGPAAWACNLCRSKGPVLREGPLLGLMLCCSHLESSFFFLTKGLHVHFPMGPTNDVGSPDQEAAYGRVKPQSDRELYLCCSLGFQSLEQCPPTL